jgi:hypothetical protein
MEKVRIFHEKIKSFPELQDPVFGKHYRKLPIPTDGTREDWLTKEGLS